MIRAAALWVAIHASLISPARGQEAAYEDFRLLVAERRFGEAAEAVEAIVDSLLAHRAEADLRYFARDFPASLAAARAGLALAPGDLTLLHRALSAALWMRAEADAVELAETLSTAVEGASLEAAERAWWEATRDSLATSTAELTASRQALERHQSRARWATAAGLAVALLGLGFLARSPQG